MVKRDDNSSNLVSIVIPALNEKKFIGKCLDSIENIKKHRGYYEVILIDNGSVDDTVAVASFYKQRLNLHIEILTGVNISALRNFGAKKAHGKILAFLDADCTVAPTWIDNAVIHFDDITIGAVGCSHKIPTSSSWIAESWFANIKKKRIAGDVSHLPSGNLFVKKEYFDAIGGFDESLITNEDYELCLRLRKFGLRVVSDPSVEAVHLGIPQTMGEFFKQQRWHGTHVMKVFLQNLSELNSIRDLKKFKAVFYGSYYLIVYGWLVCEILLLFIFPSRYMMFLPIFALIAPATILGFRIASNNQFSVLQAFQLVFLFYVYGSARAWSMWIILRNRKFLP